MTKIPRGRVASDAARCLVNALLALTAEYNALLTAYVEAAPQHAEEAARHGAEVLGAVNEALVEAVRLA